MGYVGPGLEFGAFQKIDDISSGFNGSATQFNVQIGGTTADSKFESAYYFYIRCHSRA